MVQDTRALPHLTYSYRAFLVRLWRDTLQGPWRASAQSVQSGEVVYFAHLQALFVFLEASTLSPEDDSCSAAETGPDGS